MDLNTIPRGMFYTKTTTYTPCDFILLEYIKATEMIKSISEFQIEINNDNFDEIKKCLDPFLIPNGFELTKNNNIINIDQLIKDDNIEITKENNYTEIDFNGDYSIELWINQEDGKNYLQFWNCNHFNVEYHIGGPIVHRLLSYGINLTVLSCSRTSFKQQNNENE